MPAPHCGAVKSRKTASRPNARTLVATNLRVLRARRSITQEQLALASGVSKGYISEIEKETRAVSIDILDELAAALDVSIGALFVEE